MNEKSPKFLNIVLTIASILLILTWLRYTQALVIPFLFSIFLTIIIAGPIHWFNKKGLPVSLASCLVLVIFIALILLIVKLLGSSAEQFSNNLPTYQTQLEALLQGFILWLSSYGIDLSKSEVLAAIDPGTVMRFMNTLMGSFGSIFSQIFLIIFTVLFMLMETWKMPKKINRIYGSHSDSVMQKLTEVAQDIRGYMSIKALMGLVTGFFISLGLAIIGLDFAILWGSLAFALNFIPNIGSIIAAVPAVLFSLMQLGLMETLIVIGIYVLVNVIVGNLIEPKYIGQKVGLSILVVFLSLIFWGWVLGPIGMLLSVPLTMLIKFAALSSDRTQWIAIILDSEPRELPQSDEADDTKGDANEK